LHIPISDAVRDAIATHLKVELGFEVVRAPQLPWTQAAALIAVAKLDSADSDEPPLPFYGPPEALLVDGIDSVVLAIDKQGQCLVVEREPVENCVYRTSGGAHSPNKNGSASPSPKKLEMAGIEVENASSDSSQADEEARDHGAETAGGDATDPAHDGSTMRNDSLMPGNSMLAPTRSGMQPPHVTTAIADTLTPREKRAAWIDFGILTSTHAQLAGFNVKWPGDSPLFTCSGNSFIREFNYRTLVPFDTTADDFLAIASTETRQKGSVPGSPGGSPGRLDAITAAAAAQPADCDKALDEWLSREENRGVSGIGRYRIDRFVAYGFDVRTAHSLNRGVYGSSASLMTAASYTSPQDGLFMSLVRKHKWRLLRGRNFLLHGPVAAPGVVPASEEDDQEPLIVSLSRVLARVRGEDSSPAALMIPRDLVSVCGGRVPHILQFAHLTGVVRRNTLVCLAHVYDKTDRPTVDSYLLRRCLTKGTSILCALAFEELVGVISMQAPDIERHIAEGLQPTFWYFPTKGKRSRYTRADLDEWPLERFEELQASASAEELPLDLHSVLYLSTKGVAPRPTDSEIPGERMATVYSTRRQFVAAVHLKLLDFLGYFVHPDAIECELGMYGKALARFPGSLNIMIDTYGQPNPINDSVTRQVTGAYAQQVILLIELLRTESLTSKEIVYVTSSNWDASRRLQNTHAAGVVMASETEPHTTLMTKPDRAALLLASRIACLCPIKVHGPWVGHIDRDITGFITIVQHLQRTLRRVADVLAATLLSAGRYVGNLDELIEAGAELPMSTPQSAAAGCLVRFILESPDDFGAGLTKPEQRLSFLAACFPCLLSEELRRNVVKKPSLPTPAAPPALLAGTTRKPKRTRTRTRWCSRASGATPRRPPRQSTATRRRDTVCRAPKAAPPTSPSTTTIRRCCCTWPPLLTRSSASGTLRSR
jgi:hypothetical protein